MRRGFRGAALLGWAGTAHALCAVPTADYQGGAYGAYAVTAGGCFLAVNQNGGTGSTTAAASSSFIGGDGTSYSLSSSADLGTGVLTLNSSTGISSASIWDTFTYTGLPAGGATITATLTLPGTLTLSSDGIAWLEEGSQTDFADGNQLVNAVPFYNNTNGEYLPTSISLPFTVTNGNTIIVFAEIQGSGDGLGGVADFGDPPMLNLELPAGANVTTVSAFDNFTTPTVPEPSTWAMMLIGFAGLGFAGYRRARTGGLKV
jgi:hypothetical protein